MRLYIILFCTTLVTSINAQVSDYGQWMFVGNVIEGPTHFEKPAPFPPATNKEGDVSVTYSAKEKEKMKLIVDALKEVYPKPKYHSYVLQLRNWSNKSQSEVASRNYRFGYQIEIHPEKMWVENSKIVNKKMNFVNMDATIRNSVQPLMSILVNYIPPNEGFGSFGDCPTVDQEITLTYKDTFKFTNNVKEDKYYRYANKQYILSLLNTEYQFLEANSLGDIITYPDYKFNSEADKFIVFRTIESKNLKNYYGKMKLFKDEKTEEFTTYNTIILSHNGKMPMIPLTIKEMLDIQWQEYEYDVMYWNQDRKRVSETEDYVRNKNSIDKNYDRIFKEIDTRKRNIELIKNHYQSRFQEPAIVNRAYDETFQKAELGEDRDGIYNEISGNNEKFTTEILNKLFVTNTKDGRAFYKVDREFYKNLSDGEIRTLALSWIEKNRTPNNSNFQKGNSLLTDRVTEINYADNPDYYLNYFINKMDWNKLTLILGK